MVCITSKTVKRAGSTLYSLQVFVKTLRTGSKTSEIEIQETISITGSTHSQRNTSSTAIRTESRNSGVTLKIATNWDTSFRVCVEYSEVIGCIAS